MDELRQILVFYKILKDKAEFISNYFELISTIAKKSTEILTQAIQIPRDSSWNDMNLISLIEGGEKQRDTYEQSLLMHNNISNDLKDLMYQINEEISIIEINLSEVIKQNEQQLKELDEAKKAHLHSWMKNKDPWLTDIRLKIAIKNMYTYEKNNTSIISNMISIYNDKFLNTQDLYLQIITKFCKSQKILFNNLYDVSHVKINTFTEKDKFFDAVSDTKKEIIEAKVINAYEGIITNLSNELIKKNINIYKNIEPIKFGICKLKKGITGDWILLFISVTRSRFIHFFDFQNIPKLIQKHSSIIKKLKMSNNKSFIGLFDTKRRFLNQNDEKNIMLLAKDVCDNIDKLINKIYISINLQDKSIKIDKDRNIITVDEKSQNGISSIFGINMLKIKMFSLGSCYDIYFAMQEKIETQTFECEQELTKQLPCSTGKGRVIKIEEENPWTN